MGNNVLLSDWLVIVELSIRFLRGAKTKENTAMDEKDLKIQDLTKETAKWRGRAVEAAEVACELCRASDPEQCRYCRMEKIRKEAGH